MSRAINLLPYFGGKSTTMWWLRQYLPPAKHFIDACCGTCGVALNVNYPLITVNDINEDIINFFEVMRDSIDELHRLLKNTPYARVEFERADIHQGNKIERARRFFIRSCQSYGGTGAQGRAASWGNVIEPNVKEHHFRVDAWNNKINRLDMLSKRLLRFQIESMPAVELIQKYDRKENLIYIDPPYLMAVRADKKRYKHEMTVKDHKQIAQAAARAGCMIAVSGYDHELYDKLYPVNSWYKYTSPVMRNNAKKKERQEVLWCNYDIKKIKGQLKLSIA